MRIEKLLYIYPKPDKRPGEWKGDHLLLPVANAVFVAKECIVTWSFWGG
jgi:hypothetical protein